MKPYKQWFSKKNQRLGGKEKSETKWGAGGGEKKDKTKKEKCGLRI